MSSINLNQQSQSLASLDHRPKKAGRIELDPEGAEEGLAQLVLTIIELLRQLVERQALRRVDGGNLTEEEIEQLGVALMNLDIKMEELKEIFNLTDEDLNIDLGPLGNLL